MRANPPASASVEGTKKQRVFQSALAQAEELWEAASVVGPASRPLPLFYCLSQAGRAICAAWTDSGPWEPKKHGLTTREPPSGDLMALPVSVTNEELGAFRMVASVTGSPVFEGATTLAALWASLPQFPRHRALTSDAPPWLLLRDAGNVGSQDVLAYVLSPTHGYFPFKQREELPDLLVNYPDTNGWVQGGVRTDPISGGEAEPILTFPREDASLRALPDVGDRLPDEPDGLLTRTTYAVRPRIGDGDGPPPSQLMTLWALLFGLSQLARYHPDTWVRALNPDRAKTAVPLEHGLDVALERTPELLGGGLSSGFLLALMPEQTEALRHVAFAIPEEASTSESTATEVDANPEAGEEGESERVPES